MVVFPLAQTLALGTRRYETVDSNKFHIYGRWRASRNDGTEQPHHGSQTSGKLYLKRGKSPSQVFEITLPNLTLSLWLRYIGDDGL
jgi:hypothetical protein